MVITTVCGAPIIPESAPADAAVSELVWTVIPVALPRVATPIVNPDKVMVKAVMVGIPATAVVMTIEVAVGAAEVAVIVATEAVPAALAAGVAVVAKNPEG